MKKLGRFIRGLIILTIIVVALVEVFLRIGITPLYRKAVSPLTESKMLCQSSLQRGWASLAGTVGIDEFIIHNPAGFPSDPPTLAVGSLRAHIDTREARQGRIVLEDFTLNETAIAIVRNADGKLNTAAIRDALTRLQQASTGTPPTTAPSEEAPSPRPAPPEPLPTESTVAALPPLRVVTASAYIDLIFADYMNRPDKSFRLDLAIVATGSEITTAAYGTTNWASIELTGSIRQAPEAYQTDLTLSLAPLADPLAPSFRLAGTIAQIDMSELGALQDELGITSSNIVLSVNMTADSGVFMPGSQIQARMKNATLAGELATKHPKLKLPPDLSITIPIIGTVAEPSCNVTAAVVGSVIRNVGNNLDYILDNTTIDGESLQEKANEEVNRLLKKIKF